jgi:predicted MPP superfamily phosphohydrolase
MIIWSTDLHLNFLTNKITGLNSATRFAKNIAQENPLADAWIITGDISDANYLIQNLEQLVKGFQKPIYFVFGNHDFYHSSFYDVDKKITQLTKNEPLLHWLDKEVINYNSNITIIGTTGWYDARTGNTNTSFQLNDFRLIQELKPGFLNRDLLINLIREKADNYNKRFIKYLHEAYTLNSNTIIIATHVPPYIENYLFKGKIGNRDGAPWFVNTDLGFKLDIEAQEHKDKNFIVLCGHSHVSCICNRFDNLIVYTGGAIYEHPDIAGHINIDNNIIKIDTNL